jgi:multicomponent Na+:H+ antiporter subunit D
VATVAALASGRWARAIAAVTLAAVTALAAVGLLRTLDDVLLYHQVGGWAAPLGIEYVLDPLSAFIALLIGSVSLLVVLYPTAVGLGVQAERGLFLHPVVLLLVGGLMGVAVAGDLFNLFVSLEIYSLASYALIALGGPAAAIASFRYLLLGTLGSSLYLLGVGFLYFMTGTLSMSTVGPTLSALTHSRTTAAAAALVIIGLGIKMALFPLHVWLPDAHSHAPPGVAALLAAVQVKVAAYALIRLTFDVFPPGYLADTVPVLDLLTWLGAAGVVVGSVAAIRQSDLKRMLAHSTVAQIGYLAIGIGLAHPVALVGALLHVVNHAAMKACMFFVAGGVIESAGTKKIQAMAGLGPRMPATMTAFTIAAVSMVGLPPTAGFFSKWYLVRGAGEADQWAVAAVVIGSSVLTLIYFLRVLETVWFRPRADEQPVKEARRAIVAPVIVLAAAVLALGFVNLTIVEHVLDPVATRLLSTA